MAADTSATLPLPLRTFVGRRREVREVQARLAAAQVVTLTGPAGIGKSRLAREIADRLAPSYPHGVALVELAGVDADRLVAHAVASALGVGEEPGATVVASVAAAVGNRRELLVLDNAEPVVAGCAELVEALCAECPNLSVVVTSRRPLGVTGEQAWPVPPLALPPEGSTDPPLVESVDAVELFCERAGSPAGPLTLSAESAGEVAAVCRLLGGNALAIELAAARVGKLAPAELRASLADHLAAGAREAASTADDDAAATAPAAIAWSVAQLGPSERGVLRRLAVFAGEITLAAAEEVGAGDGLATDEVFYALAGLVDRSLVVAELVAGQARYRLLGAVRAVAAEQLRAAGEAERVRARFADWHAGLVEQAEAELAGPSEGEWVARLEAERANIRAAIETSLAAGRIEMALRLAGAMAVLWRLRGYLAEGRELCQRCLDAATATDGEVDQAAVAKAAEGAGVLAAMGGEFATARAYAEASLAAGQRAGDAAACARALTLTGFVTTYEGDPATAAHTLEQAVAWARRAGSDAALADALDRSGQAHMLQGEPTTALDRFEECYEVARRVGNRHAEAYALIGMGWAAIDLGDYEAGEARIRTAADYARASGDRFHTGETLSFLAELARRRGDLDEADALLGECRQVAGAMRAPVLIARSLGGLARTELARENYAHARALFEQGAAVARDVGLPYVVVRMLIGLSKAAQATGDEDASYAALHEALDTARRHHDRQGQATASYALGNRARGDGDVDRAGRLHAEALRLHTATGDVETIARSLEALAGIALDRGRHLIAARLFGAADAGLARLGRHFARWPWEAARYDRDLARLRDALDADALAGAWQEGAARTLDDAAAYALRSLQSRQTAIATGAGELTHAQLEVARLVAQGLSSREAAERLFLSRRTVESHLQQVYRKLSITSRGELCDLAEQLPSPEAGR